MELTRTPNPVRRFGLESAGWSRSQPELGPQVGVEVNSNPNPGPRGRVGVNPHLNPCRLEVRFPRIPPRVGVKRTSSTLSRRVDGEDFLRKLHSEVYAS